MPADRARRSKKSGQYEIVVIPVGQGGKSRTYRVTAPKLWLWGAGLLLVIASVILAALVYTPLALVVPIPNPVLEEKYGRQLLETQKQLRDLAEDVLVMKEYNRQLRKALGDDQPDTAEVVKDRAEIPPLPPTQFDERTALTESTLVAEYGQFEGDVSGYNAVAAGGTGFQPALPLVSPVSGVVTQRFNPDRLHFGIDFASRQGTPVFAAADGYVVLANWTHDDGNMMMISHPGGYLTVYKHNQSLLKGQHTYVKRGELIALVGSSGKTSHGPHLHFEVWKNGVPIDPDQLLLTSARKNQVY